MQTRSTTGGKTDQKKGKKAPNKQKRKKQLVYTAVLNSRTQVKSLLVSEAFLFPVTKSLHRFQFFNLVAVGWPYKKRGLKGVMTVTWTKEITNLSTNTDVFSSGVWCARQSLRWYSAIWELWIHTTNCSTTLEAVLVCRGIHRVYLRVSNSKFTHQIPAGSERGIIGHWINNHQ